MKQNGKRPNVLFIALDDLNDWIGCLGTHPDSKTPHMDRLAQEGTLFTNACCASPVCNPSRISILTGLRPSSTGCYLLNDLLQHSPKKETTLPLPLYFRQQGYHTMTVGKIDHGDSVEKATREVHNESMWDERGGGFNGQQFDMRSRHTSCLTEVKGVHNFASHWGPLDEDQAATLSDPQVAQWASERLQKDYDKPFFLAAGFFRPHVPFIAPKEYFDLYDKDAVHLPPTGPEDMGGMPPFARQVALAGYQDYENGTHYQIMEHGYRRDIVQAYLACVSFADACVGQILKALNESPYADNTIVVLWGDNGWSLGEHFHWKKWTLWDSGSRVPLIIKTPGYASSVRCNEGVSLTDLYPTLVDLCGLPERPDLEGESLRGLLSGEEKERERPALTSFGPNNHSLRSRRWRYTKYADGSEELYDHEKDTYEHTNLAENPEYVSVKESMARWLPKENAPALKSSPPAGAPLDLESGQMVWFRSVQPRFSGRCITISATVQSNSDDNVIVHHGSWFAGYALYIQEKRLHMAVMDVPKPLRWDTLKTKRKIIKANEPLPDRPVTVEGVWDTDGTITLKVEGKTVGNGKVDGPLSIYPTGLLETGCYTDTKYPSIGAYESKEKFEGILKDVKVVFGNEKNG